MLTLPFSASAGCLDIIRSAEKNIVQTRKDMQRLEGKRHRDRVRNLLDDAKKLLKSAKELCADDASFLDKSGGTSKAVAAEGLIASA